MPRRGSRITNPNPKPHPHPNPDPNSTPNPDPDPDPDPDRNPVPNPNPNLGRIATNALAVTDDELQPIGLGMYPLAALANHSCDPTAAQTFDGATLELRALRPLAAGAPLT